MNDETLKTVEAEIQTTISDTMKDQIHFSQQKLAAGILGKLETWVVDNREMHELPTHWVEFTYTLEAKAKKPIDIWSVGL